MEKFVEEGLKLYEKIKDDPEAYKKMCEKQLAFQLEQEKETEDAHSKAIGGLLELRAKDMTTEEKQQFIHNVFIGREDLNAELIAKYKK